MVRKYDNLLPLSSQQWSFESSPPLVATTQLSLWPVQYIIVLMVNIYLHIQNIKIVKHNGRTLVVCVSEPVLL